MKLCTISKQISYLPASKGPLSSDVGFIRGDRYEWIFDIGNSDEAATVIQEIDREKNVILSHFHKDHMGNFERISYDNIYCGDFTRKKLGTGSEVKSPITIYDGVKMTLFPIPSPHSKGVIGLEVNDEVAFLGDAVYGINKNDKIIYNLNLLKDMIATFEKLKAQKFLISHRVPFIRSKEKVVTKLKEVYKMRKPGESYLYL